MLQTAGWKEGNVLFNNTLNAFLIREREMIYLTTHSIHFIYGYMASDIWLRTILIVRKETCCRHIGYSYRLTARVLLYAPSHRPHIPRPLLHQSWSTGWNEKQLKGSTMKDRSDNPMHHERTLLPWNYISLPFQLEYCIINLRY